MEYCVKNDDPDGIIYLILVEKGYYQVQAFKCLERMKNDFEKFFNK